jgi:hypothetical protein
MNRRILLLGIGGLALVGLIAVGVAVLIQRAVEPAWGGGPERSQIELRLLIEDTVGKPVYCEADRYPVAHPVSGPEKQQRYTQLQQADPKGVSAVAAHDRLATAGLSADQQYEVWSHYQRLQHIELNPEGNHYRFRDNTAKSLVEGTVARSGVISVTRNSPPAAVACPICLSGGTLIETPDGPVPVRDLRPGMAVWTAGADGVRERGAVLRTGSLDTPSGHRFVRLALADGREVLVSAGHPLADGRRVGDLQPGDQADGSTVVSAGDVDTADSATYDLLPSGPTGTYWAGGIRLASTLR